MRASVSIRDSRLARWVLVALGLLVSALLALSQRADASYPGQVRVAATSEVASASAQVTWTGRGRASQISIYVTDRKCDGTIAYAQLKFTRANGEVVYGQKRVDPCGGTGTLYGGLRFTDNFNLTYVQVMACGGNPFYCMTSSKSQRNPYA